MLKKEIPTIGLVAIPVICSTILFAVDWAQGEWNLFAALVKSKERSHRLSSTFIFGTLQGVPKTCTFEWLLQRSHKSRFPILQIFE